MRQIFDAPATATRLLLATLVAFLFSSFLMMMISQVAVSVEFINLNELADFTQTAGGRQRLRAFLLLSNLIPFAGTALLALLFVFRKNWIQAAGWTVSPAGPALLYSTGFLVLALPFVGYLTYWNLQVPLPAWMQKSEDYTDVLLTGVLTMNDLPEFLLAFLTVAVTPAIGEELLLRGVLQRRILQVWFGNHHLAIWTAAFVFSFIHFEFAGFAPRLLLGVLLGYAYYWSNSLWVPLLLHLLFNGLQVVIAYVTGSFDPGAQIAEAPPWWLAVVSLVLTVWIGRLAEARFGLQQPLVQDEGAAAGAGES